MPSPAENAAIIRAELEKAAKQYNLPQEWVLFALAVASQESNFSSGAVNDGSVTKTNEYSVGPWQINLQAHRVSVEQAQDPVFSTRHRIPSLVASWQKLGGLAGIKQLGAEEFQGRFHQMAQVSRKPTFQQSQVALQNAGQVMAGPRRTTADNAVLADIFNVAQARYAEALQELDRLQKLQNDPSLTKAERDQVAAQLFNAPQIVAAFRDEVKALWPIVKGSDSEEMDFNWTKLSYDMTRGMFADDLDLQKFLYGMVKGNNDLEQQRYDNWLKNEEIDAGTYKMLIDVRDKQQAEQLALLAVKLKNAEFISQQQAWNAVHLFQAARSGEKLYQPGFGPNDAMAQAGRMLGLNAPVIEANPVDPAQFEPEAILARAGNVTPQPHDDEWWGYTGLRQWAEDRRNRSFEPAFTGFDPSGIELPSYDNLVGEPGAGDTAEPSPATVGAITGKALRGSLESLVNAVATAPVMPATTRTRAGVDAVTAAIQQRNNLTESERAAGLQAAGNPFVAEGRPDGSYRMDEQGRMMLLPERTPPANQSQPNPLLPRKNWVFDPSKKRWVYRPAGG